MERVCIGNEEHAVELAFCKCFFCRISIDLLDRSDLDQPVFKLVAVVLAIVLVFGGQGIFSITGGIGDEIGQLFCRRGVLFGLILTHAFGHVLGLCNGIEDNEEDGRGEDIHADRIEVGHPATAHVFEGEEAGFFDKVFYRVEELAVEVGNIVEKVLDKVPYGLFGFEVLLTAFVAVAADCLGLAVKAILFLSFV